MRKIAFLLVLFAVPLQADLASQVRAANGWVGYSVPIIDGRHYVCSWDESINIVSGVDDYQPRSSALHVLYQVERGKVLSVRLSSPECRSTRQVQWIPGVDPRESVRFLLSLVNAEESGKKAIGALALHRDTPDEDLIALARRHRDSKIRSNALFWISQRAGDKAAGVLRDAIDNDPDADVQTKAVFGISQLPNDKSIPLLIDLMKTHRNPRVRKKAAFWLGQKDDPRALNALEDLLTH